MGAPQRMSIGVDVGGVIVRLADYVENATVNGPEMTAESAVAGAADGLAHLSEVFDRRVFLVSKCGPLTELRFREWLDGLDLLDAVGIPIENVRFCRMRSEKAKICAELAITHFVDDRLEVLQALGTVVAHRFLFSPNPAEVERFGPIPADVVAVSSWAEQRREMVEATGAPCRQLGARRDHRGGAGGSDSIEAAEQYRVRE